MNGWMIFGLYIASFVVGFGGGVFGCLYFKKLEKRKAEKHKGDTVIVDC